MEKPAFTRVSEEPVRLIESTHTYLVNEGLLEFSPPSLSEVMRAGGFAVDYSQVDPTHLKFRARVGTETHRMIARMLNGYGDSDYPADRLLARAITPHMAAFESFDSEHELEPIFIELPMFSPLFNRRQGYGFTGDFIGFVDGEPWVLDYKTTYSISETVRLQTMGQRLGFRYSSKERVRRGALHLRRNGTYVVVEHKDDATDEATLRAIVWSYHARVTYGLSEDTVLPVDGPYAVEGGA